LSTGEKMPGGSDSSQSSVSREGYSCRADRSHGADPHGLPDAGRHDNDGMDSKSAKNLTTHSSVKMKIASFVALTIAAALVLPGAVQAQKEEMYTAQFIDYVCGYGNVTQISRKYAGETKRRPFTFVKLESMPNAVVSPERFALYDDEVVIGVAPAASDDAKSRREYYYKRDLLQLAYDVRLPVRIIAYVRQKPPYRRATQEKHCSGEHGERMDVQMCNQMHGGICTHFTKLQFNKLVRGPVHLSEDAYQ